MTKMRVMVIGGTGLVGEHVVQALMANADVEAIHCLVRRSNVVMSKQVHIHPVNFMDLDAHASLFSGITHVICCVGTTMALAGSREQFQLVDHYIPKEVARLAQAAGVEGFVLVSSLGANPQSRSFYLRVKGQIEAHLTQVGFLSLHIYRPSLLVGKRSEFRWLEWAMLGLWQIAGWAFPSKYAPTRAEVLGRVMVRQLKVMAGIHIIESSMIPLKDDLND